MRFTRAGPGPFHLGPQFGSVAVIRSRQPDLGYPFCTKHREQIRKQSSVKGEQSLTPSATRNGRAGVNLQRFCVYRRACRSRRNEAYASGNCKIALMRKPRGPRPPRGLQTAGKRLWSEVWGIYELDRVESGRLERVCQLADIRESLLGEVHGVQTSAELRRLSELIDKLLTQLGVGGGEIDQSGRSSRSGHAQAMANARWRQQGLRQAEQWSQTRRA
jgi:hypothetical protein